jgi:hypothetical protein
MFLFLNHGHFSNLKTNSKRSIPWLWGLSKLAYFILGYFYYIGTWNFARPDKLDLWKTNLFCDRPSSFCSRDYIHETIASLRPRKYFLRHPVNNGVYIICSRAIDLRGRKVVRALWTCPLPNMCNRTKRMECSLQSAWDISRFVRRVATSPVVYGQTQLGRNICANGPD